LALLLDTNVLIWVYEDDPRLSNRVRERLLKAEDSIYVSVLSAWEYGQKRRKYPAQLRPDFEDMAMRLPHIKLGLEYDVHRYAETLPPIHADPFDRMLIAQALHHDLELVASDEKIRQYPVRTFW
jgi:PIN domain nuclease of toxin-antitoxin system